MSRVGKLPISIPKGVTVDIQPPNLVTVKGPKGELKVTVDNELKLEQSEGTVTLSRSDNHRRMRSQHGVARPHLKNALPGGTQGHSQSRAVSGVGTRAQ